MIYSKSWIRRFTRVAAAATVALASIVPTLPAQAVVSGYVSLRTVKTYDVAGGYTDRTIAAGNATVNDVSLGGDQVGDTIYFGSDLKFENVVLTIGTGTAGGGTVSWEYSNDAAIFSPLPGVSQTWATAGSFPVNFSAPLDWTKRTIDGTNRYWLRASWTNPRSPGSVEPKLSQASALLLNYQVSVHDEFGGGIAGLQDLNFTLSNCSDTNVYKVKDYGTGLYELALLVSGADTTCDLHIEQTNYLPSPTVSTGPLSSSIQQNAGVITMNYQASALQSTNTSNPGTIPGDNVTPSQITVTVKNWNNIPLQGRTVTLSSNHAGDTITGSPATANASGLATFSVKSSNAGTAQYTAIADGVTLTARASVTYTAVGPAPDATAPTVGLISPTSVTALVATTISATYSDNVGVSACDLILDETNVGAMTLSTPGGMSGTASRVTTLASGNHTARASCRDAAENNGQGLNVTIVANASPAPDVTPPIVGTPTPTTATVNVAQTYSTTVSDNVGISECSFYVDGASQPTTVAGGFAQRTHTFSTVGSHTMYIRCADDAGNIGTGPTVTISVTALPASPDAGGRLIKLACPAGALVTHSCKAVYYVGSGGKRHAFPNDKVYFTWYADFSGVEIVTAAEMSSHSLGKNVTYRPGIKMIKFATLANTYAIARGGVLRWITSEDVARSLYGTSWNRQVDDVSDAFYTNYAFGTDIVSTAHYSPSGETASATNIDLNF